MKLYENIAESLWHSCLNEDLCSAELYIQKLNEKALFGSMASSIKKWQKQIFQLTSSHRFQQNVTGAHLSASTFRPSCQAPGLQSLSSLLPVQQFLKQADWHQTYESDSFPSFFLTSEHTFPDFRSAGALM